MCDAILSLCELLSAACLCHSRRLVGFTISRATVGRSRSVCTGWHLLQERCWGDCCTGDHPKLMTCMGLQDSCCLSLLLDIAGQGHIVTIMASIDAPAAPRGGLVILAHHILQEQPHPGVYVSMSPSEACTCTDMAVQAKPACNAAASRQVACLCCLCRVKTEDPCSSTAESTIAYQRGSTGGFKHASRAAGLHSM